MVIGEAVAATGGSSTGGSATGEEFDGGDRTPLTAGDAVDPGGATTVRTGPPRPGLLAVALAIVMICCVQVAFLWAFAYGLSSVQEQRSQHLLYERFRGALDPSSPDGPSIGGKIRPGTPVALIDAPVAGMHNVVVVEGTSSADLLAGPGHRRDTPLPGQPGESMLIGRSTTSGAPFRNLYRLARGDLIDVRTGQGDFHYTVTGTLAPNSTPAPIPGDSGLLVMVTSTKSGGFADPPPGGLLYVEARLRGSAVTSPSGRPTHVRADEIQGRGETGAWPDAGAWLAALIVASGFAWFLWSRWGILRAWLVAAPILLWVMWELSNSVMGLLPNVY
jgi:sortase A